MTRRCILHIGMNKAGSSTLQKCFRDYDDHETYFLPVGPPNHSKLVSCAFSTKVPERYYDTKDLQARQDLCVQKRDELTSHIERDRRNVIISAEMLSVFPDSASVDAVIAFLRKYFDKVNAIAYIRDPAGYMASQFQQSLRNGAPAFNLNQLYPDYAGRFARWSEGLGAAIDFVALNSNSLHEGNLAVDFSMRMGLKRPNQRRLKVVANSSLSAEAMAVLFVYRHASKWIRTDTEHTRSINRSILRHLHSFGNGKFGFRDDVIVPYLASKADDIAWMQRLTHGDMIGQASKKTEITFGSTKDIVDFAHDCRPVLADWFRKTFPDEELPSGDVIDIMDAAYASLQA